jgi:hypothetical protein
VSRNSGKHWIHGEALEIRLTAAVERAAEGHSVTVRISAAAVVAP